MSKAHPLKTPMMARSLDEEKNPFRPRSEDEKVL
jgi:hypothetical protein